jgi:hypothetical protein
MSPLRAKCVTECDSYVTPSGQKRDEIAAVPVRQPNAWIEFDKGGLKGSGEEVCSMASIWITTNG